MNTLKKGSVTFLIIKERGARYYTGICLDFGIVIQDKDENLVKAGLEEATYGYLKAVAKEGLGAKLLNRQAEKKYFDIYNQILSAEQKKLSSKSKKFNESSLTDKYKEINWNLMPVSSLMQSCA